MKTLEELAKTSISELEFTTGSVFSPTDSASKMLGVLEDSKRTEAVASGDGRHGIITIRDLLEVDQPAKTRIDTIWKQVGTVNQNTSVLDAVDIMIQNGVTAIPFVTRDSVSLVSQQDITSAMKNVSELKNMKAKDIIMYPVITATTDTPIAHVRRTMLDKGFSHIPILNDEKVVGIITGEEIVSTFIIDSAKTTTGDRSGEKVPKFPGQVSGLMNRQPLHVTPDTSVQEVIRKIDNMGEKYCLVVDEEQKLHGIITHRELLKVIQNLKPEPELPVYIVGIERENFFETAVVEDKIRRTVERSMKIMEEITEVSIRVKTQRNKGERTRYMITARALGPSFSFNVENEDWGLMEAFDGLIDALDKTLRRAKKEPQKKPRHGRRRPYPHLKP